jgi:hypothetical protein
MNKPLEKFPTDQMRREIQAVIRRYGQESDVTVYAALGVLDIVMADLREMLESAQREN